jgi:hypothetical protein
MMMDIKEMRISLRNIISLNTTDPIMLQHKLNTPKRSSIVNAWLITINMLWSYPN